MFHTQTPGKSFLRLEEYRDKVLGCWTGKNIGGTLGAPMEGKHDLFDVSFYTQDLGGKPVPNDDLDLQLIWLKAVEEHGIYQVNERLLGEYWLAHITGPWNEYGVGKFNMLNGLPPPLSGLCNNERWKNSNGAWIRSEIWACLFPGEPDEDTVAVDNQTVVENGFLHFLLYFAQQTRLFRHFYHIPLFFRAQNYIFLSRNVSQCKNIRTFETHFSSHTKEYNERYIK